MKNYEMSEEENKFTEMNNSDEEKREKIIQQLLGPKEDSLCGIGYCRQNKYIQKLARPSIYLVVSSVIALIQGLFFTYSNATLSTIEKQFGLPSRLSGLTTTGNDVILLILSLPLPFIAGRSHRPRWLAFAMILSAFGCFIAVTPHIWFNSNDGQVYNGVSDVSKDYNHKTKNENQLFIDSNACQNFDNSSRRSCSNSTTSSQIDLSFIKIVATFSIAQMFAGVASLLYYTIGYSYLDEAVAKEKVPFFLSISGGMRLLGPVCGYSLASWALNKWVDPSETSNISISPSHPHWIGAWWLGYIVIGVLLLSLSWILILLPRTLPSTRKRKYKELISVAIKNPEEFHQLSETYRPARNKNWKEMGPSLVRILSSKIYRLVVFNQVLFWFSFFGYITFKSKYLEHQFKLSAAEANRYIAVVSLIAALIGWLGTGATLSLMRPKTKSVIIYMAVLSSISCFCHLLQLSVFCDHPDVYGLNQQIIDKSPQNSLTIVTDCEQKCDCHSDEFSPVCLTNSTTTFYNSCYANCYSRNSSQSDQSPVFSDGFCIPMCSSFTIYLAISVLAKMSQAASRVPVNLILLRSVNERDKDLCLGVFNAALALGASIPAPIIFGWALDSTCILWKGSCSGNLQCWLYDNDSFRKIIHGLPAVFLALCFITDLLLLRHHKEIILYPDKKKQQDSTEKVATL